MVSRSQSLAAPLLLTFNAGYVDTAGFLAIAGLFTAHVTGNFVTIGAALVAGSAGVVTKLLALPVFCLAVLSARLLGLRWERQGADALHRLLLLHLMLLVTGCVAAIWVPPAHVVDEWMPLAAGLLLVAAMGVQNGLHRTHLAAFPPSTLMTGTTTQIVIDLADFVAGKATPATAARARSMVRQVAVFAAGCATAALLFDHVGAWCFVLPPVCAAMALLLLPKDA